MSWCNARSSSMTNTFSLCRIAVAGKELGILMGMAIAPHSLLIAGRNYQAAFNA
jgi:hypothetical protein